MRLLITGAAGFIGYHLAQACLKRGDEVYGIDNLNDYYDVRLKQARLELLQQNRAYNFAELDISNEGISKIFAEFQPQQVVHLAAQAGVRYSLTNPHLYVQTNVLGFTKIIELCRQNNTEHFIYASSSSVYGANQALPFQERQVTDHPLSVYAATKKANELLAHSYSHLYQLPTTGLRFFTVYGPWGRPDMAFFSFTRDILAGKPIIIFNNGDLQRDFTYVEDIVQGILQAIDQIAAPNANWDGQHPCSASSLAPYRIYNIGYGEPVSLLDYIDAIEQTLDKKAIRHFAPMQKTDVISTHADIGLIRQNLDYRAKIAYREGIKRFIAWYLQFYPQ